MSANFESGVFTRHPAWHRQGVVVETAPDIDTAFEIAAMDWTVKKMPVYTRVGGHVMEDTGHKALIRNKDGQENLLGIARSRYEIFQNQEAREWARPLLESGRWSLETAGVLCEGRKCWLLLKQGEREIIPGDTLRQYLLFHWGHDGMSPAVFQPTAIRVVCDNTLQESLRSGKSSRVVHSSTMRDRMGFVQSLFTSSEEAFQGQMEVFSRLLDKTLTQGAIEQAIDEVYGPRDAASKISRTFARKKTDFLKEFVLGQRASGMRELGIGGTAWGVYNALTEANEHYLFKGDASLRMLNGGLAMANARVMEALMAA